MKTKTQLSVYEIARHYCEDNADTLGPEILNLVRGAIRARDFRCLAQLSSNLDMHRCDVHRYRAVRQIEAFFKKNSDFAIESECEAAAMSSFNRGELICKITNKRLQHYYDHPDRMCDSGVVVARAQDFIKQILGSLDDFVEAIPSLLRVTSGASATSPRSSALPFQKLERTMRCTPRCQPYVRAAYLNFGYAAPRVKPILWNRVEFVPKSWKTHRSIACEPAGNVPFQLAFDEWAKEGLARRGINLRDQTSNQEYAYQGSVSGAYATIDLSMASDTLSFNTVAWLLPSDWFEFLSDVRSPMYRLPDGTMGKYAKFSSMGNGATFSLETLIFASILHAIGSTTFNVYGDDIIVGTDFVGDLYKWLKFFGFVPNVDKSYSTGPFRESCGKDYYRGVDITPFYIRSTASWDVPNTCHNVNGLAEISAYGALWDFLSDFVRKEGLPLTPRTLDTTTGVHLHPTFAYAQGLIRVNKQGILQHKRIVRKNSSITCVDSRSLALWFLSKNRRKSGALHPLLPTVHDFVLGSRYSASSHKYVRKWVAWNYSGSGTAGDLYGFSATLTR